MADDQIVRKIAVIFVTDVVGFSKLMEKNEDATLKSLRSCRDIMDTLFLEHGGRVFNTAGDSVLAEFQSAVSAVLCATEFQKLIKQRNASVEEISQMHFRVGINMGDVIVEGTNLYGDGVNVAARLEALSQPGGVSLSKSIHDFVSQKVELNFADLGNQKVKNTVIHAFDVSIEGVENRILEAASVKDTEGGIDSSKPPTIAVLPFKNMSNDEEQEYFADGVTEDIIGNLSSWKSFPVISRNSSFSFKGKEIQTSEIGKQLGADYAVQGSIRKGGNKVRISASLVDIKDDQEIWTKRWDRLLDDIFEVQDEVSQEVAAQILPALKGKEQDRIKTKSPKSFSAWDNYLQALAVFNRNNDFEASTTAHQEVMALCDAAIASDPQLCDAFVLKTRSIYNRLFSHEYREERQANEALFHEFSAKAYSIDPNNPEAATAYSRSFNIKKDFAQRIRYAKQALDLNPSHAGSNYDYGLAICNDANFTDAEYHIQKAIDLDPMRRQSYEGFLPLLYLAMRDSEKALEWSNIISDRNPHSRYDGFRAAIFAHLGDIEKAKSYLKKFKDQRSEIISIDDYKSVAPSIAMNYLTEGLNPIWDL
jgi:adenylate cyclase